MVSRIIAEVGALMSADGEIADANMSFSGSKLHGGVGLVLHGKILDCLAVGRPLWECAVLRSPAR